MYINSPPQKSEQGRTHFGFETQRRRHQKSKTGVPVAKNKNKKFTAFLQIEIISRNVLTTFSSGNAETIPQRLTTS